MKKEDFSLVHESVTDEEIARIISRWTGIPLSLIHILSAAAVGICGGSVYCREDTVSASICKTSALETGQELKSSKKNRNCEKTWRKLCVFFFCVIC